MTEQERAALRETSAVMVEVLVALKEFCRRVPGNGDLEGRISFAFARMAHVHDTLTFPQGDHIL